MTALASLFVVVAAGANSGTIFSSQGYRIKHYRGVVADAPAGVQAISTAQIASALRDEKVTIVVINVLPATMMNGRFIGPQDTSHISGGIWLPNVGFGHLNEANQGYFAAVLGVLRQQYPQVKMTFYCKVNCWHAWNAAKRAVDLGYANVYWYADGIEGWLDAGFDSVTCQPFSLEKQFGSMRSGQLSLCK